MKVKDLFDIEYPKTLIYTQMNSSKNGINFVSSQEKNNGVVGKVEPYEGAKLYPAGIITVPLKGSVLMAHYQSQPCYVAHQVAVLASKTKISLQEKLFYCLCIKQNAFRFSYGRQADKTLKDIELPDTIPDWVYNISAQSIKTSISKRDLPLSTEKWAEYEIQDIFDICYGINLELLNCEISDNTDENINFVSRTSANNGVVARVKPIAGKSPQKAGLLSCSGGGSVLSTFVQKDDFYSGRDLYVLTPKYPMSIYSKLFCCTVIEKNKYKFNYGRQANKTLPILKIKLPCLQDRTPDFDYMENYIKSLPYSDKI